MPRSALLSVEFLYFIYLLLFIFLFLFVWSVCLCSSCLSVLSLSCPYHVVTQTHRYTGRSCITGTTPVRMPFCLFLFSSPLLTPCLSPSPRERVKPVLHVCGCGCGLSASCMPGKERVWPLRSSYGCSASIFRQICLNAEWHFGVQGDGTLGKLLDVW